MPQLKLTAITPQHLPSTKEYLKAMTDGVQSTGSLIMRDMQSTVRTWDHKPTFYVVIHNSKGDYAIIAGTDNLIYMFVDHGTKAHRIPKVGSTYMSFYSGYRAKTRVGVIGSQAGGPTGSKVSAMVVRHPGFPGRQFIMRIAKRRQVTMRQMTEQNIAKVNRTQR